MNDLGMTMAWSAVQVSLVMVPAAMLHVLASRRGAASGASMAVVGLALSVAIGVAAFLPRPRGGDESPGSGADVGARAGVIEANDDATTGPADRMGVRPARETGRPAVAWSLSFAGFRGVLQRLERGAAAPTARLGRWGGVVAVVGFFGAGVGLFQLVLGLWAVGLYRRCGVVVDDRDLVGLLDEIRVELGCRRAVKVREILGLSTPATIGWRQPIVLLPDGWRSWDDADRRAVLAHELAHIRRWDYAAGLVARLALALGFYHPLVRWMAGRLALQQELAADAVGARFAGGRGTYLRTLSRLALEQDGRSTCWPARAFLPARGTLIRRIAMLQDQSVVVDRPWSGWRRLLAGLGLLGVAVVVATLRGPARAADDVTSSVASHVSTPAPGEDVKADASRFDFRFFSDTMPGVVAFRPAATFRKPGMARFLKLIGDGPIAEIARACNVDLSRPGRLKFGLEDIEWVIAGLNFGRSKNDQGPEMHRLELGTPTIRMTAPFDWLRFLREWGADFAEVRDGGRVYYKVIGVAGPALGPNPCVYLPDDRTIVLHDEAAIRALLRRETPDVPADLAGPDWERASRGLLAIAIRNHDGAFAKTYDLGRPDDAVVLSLFKGVDRWIFGVDDADAIALHAAAACRGDASESIARAVESLVKLGRKSLANPEPGATSSEFHDRTLLMMKTLLTNLRVGRDDRSVVLDAVDFGTLAEFGAIVEAEFNETEAQDQDEP